MIYKKAAFGNLKDGLLACQRRPFLMRKVAFGKTSDKRMAQYLLSFFMRYTCNAAPRTTNAAAERVKALWSVQPRA